MTRVSRIEALFEEACALHPGERAAFVARSAGDDEALRAEVMSLLDHAIGAAETIELAVVRGASDYVRDHGSRHVGRRIGPYTITGLLGEGGMGAVYAAERTDEFAQRVAIKILPFGLDLPEAIARFRDERQILASLEHPNIVRLFDGGHTDDDRPYLVMERIDGTPITEYATGHVLSVAARIRLFRDVCEAVHYAHGKLVIHRDLKPSNILVDASGSPKLLDFGIAKLADPLASRGSRTRTGTALLTPEYASPEQAAGEPVSFASDIYSLGVVLRELLPAHVDRDLETIILAATREEPAQRYASAEELADDLARYLAQLPVRAHRPTLRYRAGKYVARHRLALVTAGAIAIAASTATWMLLHGSARTGNWPAHDRKIAVVAVNRGSADDDWLAPGVARLEARRLRERDDRFMVVDDPAAANVIARLEFRRTAHGAAVDAVIGPQRLERIESPTLATSLDQLTPLVADVVARDQPERGPDADERTAMAHLGARSFAAYRAYQRLTFDALRTLEYSDAELARRAEKVIALDPAWLHPYSLLFFTVPTNDTIDEIQARARSAGDRTRDPDGIGLLEGVVAVDDPHTLDAGPVERGVAAVSPIVQRDPDDLLAAWTLVATLGMTRTRGAQRLALLQQLHERYPQLRFGKDLADAYRDAGRSEDADRTLRDWLRAAPDAETAFVAQLPAMIDASNADAAVRIARDLVFMHGESARNLLVLCDTLIAADRAPEAAAVADRLLAGPIEGRAIARNRVAAIAIHEGRFGSALETLTSPDETDVGNLEVARRLTMQLGAIAETERIDTRIAALTAGQRAEPSISRARRFEKELEHGCPSMPAVLAEIPKDAPIREFAVRWLARAAAAKGCVPCSDVVHLGFSTTEADAYSLLELADCAEHEAELQLAKDALDRIPAFHDPYLSILVRYRRGRILERQGKPAEARSEYEAFLAHWGHADRALPDIDDARAALARLSR